MITVDRKGKRERQREREREIYDMLTQRRSPRKLLQPHMGLEPTRGRGGVKIENFMGDKRELFWAFSSSLLTRQNIFFLGEVRPPTPAGGGGGGAEEAAELCGDAISRKKMAITNSGREEGRERKSRLSVRAMQSNSNQQRLELLVGIALRPSD